MKINKKKQYNWLLLLLPIIFHALSIEGMSKYLIKNKNKVGIAAGFIGLGYLLKDNKTIKNNLNKALKYLSQVKFTNLKDKEKIKEAVAIINDAHDTIELDTIVLEQASQNKITQEKNLFELNDQSLEQQEQESQEMTSEEDIKLFEKMKTKFEQDAQSLEQTKEEIKKKIELKDQLAYAKNKAEKLEKIAKNSWWPFSSKKTDAKEALKELEIAKKAYEDAYPEEAKLTQKSLLVRKENKFNKKNWLFISAATLLTIATGVILNNFNSVFPSIDNPNYGPYDLKTTTKYPNQSIAIDQLDKIYAKQPVNDIKINEIIENNPLIITSRKSIKSFNETLKKKENDKSREDAFEEAKKNYSDYIKNTFEPYLKKKNVTVGAPLYNRYVNGEVTNYSDFSKEYEDYKKYMEVYVTAKRNLGAHNDTINSLKEKINQNQNLIKNRIEDIVNDISSDI